MKKKKSRFWLFILSFFPGAGEMYLGFMKMGVSLLSVFILLAMLAVYTNIGVLALPLVVIYVYSFFLANNLGALSDEEFYQMEDRYLFGIDEGEFDSVKSSLMGRYRKLLAVILICLGVAMLWNTADDFLRGLLGNDFYNLYIRRFMRTIANQVPRFVIGIAVVWFGIKLIQGKKVELEQMEQLDETESQDKQEKKEEEKWN